MNETSATDRKPVVALVFGGNSSEHGVSCLTAASVAKAIDPERFELVGIAITPSGRWTQVDAEWIRQLQVVGQQLPAVDEGTRTAVLLPADSSEARPMVATVDGAGLVDHHEFDVAFSLIHGPFGEDGTIQGLFEMAGVRYVGAGVAASAVGMDKHMMKMVLQASGLPVGPYRVITDAQWRTDRDAALSSLSELEFPVYVKPARGGSSMGINRVDDPAGLREAIEEARGFDPKIVVEQGFVDAREVECGVLGSLDSALPKVSGPAEIRMHTEDAFYDFEAKYLPEEQVSIDLPADLDEEVSRQVRDLAVRTFLATDCEGLARVDSFVTAEGQIVVNEINTMPGFTEHSMFPQLWAHSGLAYPELIAHLLQLALTRPVGLR